MTEQTFSVNAGAASGAASGSAGTFAPLKNVTLFHQMMRELIERDPDLPGIGVFYGHSGLGKSWAAAFSANRHRAVYVEAGYSWTTKVLISAILKEIGAPPPRTVADGVQQAIEAFQDDPRPLIVDEADFLIRRGNIEVVREIHDRGGVPVVLIGEETLPAWLEKWERIHNRVLAWQPARPADLEDAHALVKAFVADVEVADDLMAALHKACRGRVRRIRTSLNDIASFARRGGLATVDLDAWKASGLAFRTGKAPARRVD